MSTTTEKENIFMFVPNLIGYARIVLAIVSFYYMPTNYVIAGWCYIVSVVLDALDGHAARHLIHEIRRHARPADRPLRYHGTAGDA